MCLSTVTKENRPASRYVLLKGHGEDGFVWYTNYNSRKGDELLNNPYAALVLWWGDMERSIRIEGKVERLTDKENDDYFNKRHRGFKIDACVSHQSQPIDSQAALHKQYEQEQA